MGMYSQLILHDGDDVKFDAKLLQNNTRVDLAITHHGNFLSDLTINMTVEQARALRSELTKVTDTARRAPDTTVYGQGAGNDDD